MCDADSSDAPELKAELAEDSTDKSGPLLVVCMKDQLSLGEPHELDNLSWARCLLVDSGWRLYQLKLITWSCLKLENPHRERARHGPLFAPERISNSSMCVASKLAISFICCLHSDSPFSTSARLSVPRNCACTNLLSGAIW